MLLRGYLQSLVLELEDEGGQRAYSSGELLHGRVRLELRGALRLRALEVCARGLATVHWVESICLGVNTVYCDYTDYQTFLHHHCRLIPGKAGAWGWFSAPGPWVGTPVGCEDLCPGGCLPSQAGPFLLASPFSPVPRASPLLVSRKLPANLGAGERRRVVAFVLFAEGRANRSVCSQVWKEHLAVQ